MKLFGATVLASLLATGAFAGGYVAPVVETPVVVETETAPQFGDWTGFYAGAQYGQGEAKAEFGSQSGKRDLDAYGVFAGYQHDFGSYVLGGELNYNKVELDDVSGKGDLLSLRARAGYDLGRFLPYVTVGYAYLDADDSENGLVYGIGGDFKVTERFVLGAEYTRHDFDDIGNVSGLDLKADTVQVRASFRF